MRIAPVLALALLAGCPGSFGGNNGSCATDGDCYGGEVCANVHRCYASDQVHAVSVHWTIDGQPADTTRCASGPQLDLTIVDPAGQDTSTFSPVPCASGAFPFSRLPVEYTSIQLTNPNNGVSATGDVPSGGGVVNIDLGFGTGGDLDGGTGI